MKEKLNTNFILCILVVVTYSISDAFAWTAFGYYHNDANPGKCTIANNLILAPGESAKSPNSCAKMMCIDENGRTNIHGCIKIGTPRNCEWGPAINEDAPYPECCARHIICYNPENETMAAEYEDMIYNQLRDNVARHSVTTVAAHDASNDMHKQL